MDRFHKFVRLAALALFLAAGTNPSFGQSPHTNDVALIDRVTGTTEPALEPGTGIRADSLIQLGEGASITFLHYQSCRLVSVAGSGPGSATTVRIGYPDYAVAGGQITAEKQVLCAYRFGLYPAGSRGSPGCLGLGGGNLQTKIEANGMPLLIGGPLRDKVRRLQFDEITKTGAPGEDHFEIRVVHGEPIWTDRPMGLKENAIYDIRALSDDGVYSLARVKIADRTVPDEKVGMVVLLVSDGTPILFPWICR